MLKKVFFTAIFILVIPLFFIERIKFNREEREIFSSKKSINKYLESTSNISSKRSISQDFEADNSKLLSAEPNYTSQNEQKMSVPYANVNENFINRIVSKIGRGSTKDPPMKSSTQIIDSVSKPSNDGINQINSSEEAERNIQKFCLGFRHKEGEGIGYKNGYTTLEGQYISSFLQQRMSIFLDLRLHYFNNATFAANSGFGLRYLTKDSNVFGLNIYYDSRKIHNHPVFNQIAVGVEWLGIVDCRFNAYIPIQNTEDFSSSCQKNYPGGYRMIQRKYKKAITSVFFEVGSFLEQSKNFSVYGAVSQYYLELCKCNMAFGGKTRLKLTFYNFFGIEFIASYDTFYKTRGQIGIGLHYCWGGKKNDNKLFNNIYHNEIIPLGNCCKYDWNW